MKKLILFCLLPAFLSASPFSGFYLGGGLGWDYFLLKNQQIDVEFPTAIFINNRASGSGFCGDGYVGWTRCCGAVHIGARIGYQGFSNARAVIFRQGLSEVWKRQGAFVDLLPGLQFSSCWYAHLLFGVGYTQYRFFGMNQFQELFRDQKAWSYQPRLGAGLKWAFWRCLTAGFEWIYNFPGRPVWYGPSAGLDLTDQNNHWERFAGNQFLFTLNWYFYR